MRAVIGLAVAFALASVAAPAPAAESTDCKFGNERIAPGKAMCLNGFTTECRPNGAWAVNRQAPCFSGVTARRACTVSPVEIAAPGARSCHQGRARQCSDRGEWIDLAGGC